METGVQSRPSTVDSGIQVRMDVHIPVPGSPELQFEKVCLERRTIEQFNVRQAKESVPTSKLSFGLFTKHTIMSPLFSYTAICVEAPPISNIPYVSSVCIEIDE